LYRREDSRGFSPEP